MGQIFRDCGLKKGALPIQSAQSGTQRCAKKLRLRCSLSNVVLRLPSMTYVASHYPGTIKQDGMRSPLRSGYRSALAVLFSPRSTMMNANIDHVSDHR